MPNKAKAGSKGALFKTFILEIPMAEMTEIAMVIRRIDVGE